MPGLNQTGPMGQGPMTGQRMGRCSNFGTNLKNKTFETKEIPNENLPENFQGQGFGFGRGRGFGMGRGRGRRLGLQNHFSGGF